MDWLYASLFQCACDWGTLDTVRAVAACWGVHSVDQFEPLSGLSPPITVAVTDAFVFVASGSTKDVLQWLGNLLGSPALPWAYGPGAAAAYFQTVALAQYAAARSAILAAAPGRRVVLCGFSLGSASMTLLKPILAQQDGIDASCFAVASPRVGTATFALGYPSANFQRWQYQLDPVPSMPPTTWSGSGQHAAFIPSGSLVTYQHVPPGHTLYTPSEIRAGDQLVPLADAILGFDLALYRQWHNAGLYASILRRGLSDELIDGQDDHPQASRYDDLSAQTFPSPSPWPWSIPMATVTPGGLLLQLTLGFRNRTSAPGWKEIYYFRGTDPGIFVTSFLGPNRNNPLQTRASFLSQKSEIYYLRVSRVGSVKAHRLIKFPAPIVGQDSTSSALAADSIAMFGYDVNFKSRRQFHFRGLPDSYVSADLLTSTGQAALPRIQQFLRQLEDFNSVILSPVITLSSKISGCIKAAAHDPITLTLETPLTVPSGSLIEIVGTAQTKLLAGRWLTPGTAGVPSTTLKVAASAWLNPDPDTVGTLRVLGYDTANGYALDSYQFNGVAKRNTGRQDFLPRGKRSAKIRRR